MLRKRLRAALVVYGLVNAVLYCSLLPLWEGFDEAFHYGYVQSLSGRARFPVLGESHISNEIWASMQLAPVSHVVKQYIPQLTSFSEYFRLSREERLRRRQQLEILNPALGRSEDQGAANYEAQQAPLAYLLLAGPDRIWSAVPILERVWRLRLICAIASTLLMMLCTLRLCAKLKLPERFRNAAVFLVLSSQMLYASNAHIANDWLAIPLVGFLFLAAAEFAERPGLRTTLAFSLVLAAGLLTKAYFLVFVPVAALGVLWCALRRRVSWRAPQVFVLLVGLLSGPWYVRNLLLYDNLGGLQESVAKITAEQILQSFRSIPWPAALAAAARSSLWTSNGSFGTFSASTLNAMLLLLGAALALWLWSCRKKRPRAAEWVLATGSVVFSLALVYAMVNFYALSAAAARGATPWYAQALLPAVFSIAMLGLERSGVLGRALCAAMVITWTYLLTATYWLKLIPFYGGMEQPRAQLGILLSGYAKGREHLFDMLGSVSLASPGLILAMAALSAALGFLLCFLLCTGDSARGSSNIR